MTGVSQETEEREELLVKMVFLEKEVLSDLLALKVAVAIQVTQVRLDSRESSVIRETKE